MKTLIINSFGLFPTHPPYSTSYVYSMLKSKGVVVEQIDMNLLLWEILLSREYLSQRTFRPEIYLESKNPLSPEISEKIFTLMKQNTCEQIEHAKAILRSKKDFYSPKRLLWACNIIFQSQQVIYYEYGTLFLSKVIFWPKYGFNINSISGIYELSSDYLHNMFIDIIETHVIPKIVDFSPSIIGIDFQFPWEIVVAVTLNRLIRKHLPNVHINFMGYGFDDVCFARIKDKMAMNEKLFFGFDSIFLVRNDEQLMIMYTGEDFSPDRLRRISSLAYVDKSTKRIFINGPFEESRINQDVIPNYDALDLKAYFTPELVLLDKLSTKCFWSRCSYCSINAFKKYRQEVNVDKFLSRIRYYQQHYKCRNFFLLDEAATPELANSFSKLVKQERLNIIWSLRTRIDPAYDRELLLKMYNAGCRELWIGLETVSPVLLKQMDKTEIPEAYADVATMLMQNCQNIGIGLHFCLILGFPTETEDDYRQLYDFFRKNVLYVKKIPFFLTFNIFNLQIGSRIYKQPHLYGISRIIDNEDNLNMSGVPFESVNGNDLFNKKFEEKLNALSERITSLLVRKESLKLLWFASAESPWELLMKSNNTVGNFFLEKESIVDKIGLVVYRMAKNYPVLFNLLNFIMNRKSEEVKVQLYH
ncbi:MAG: radical SAM protein [bacterium]